MKLNGLENCSVILFKYHKFKGSPVGGKFSPAMFNYNDAGVE